MDPGGRLSATPKGLRKLSPLVDAGVASRFAGRFASAGCLDRSYLLDGLQDSFEDLVREAEPLIAEESGFFPGHPAVPRVLSRQDWATANVGSMLEMMSPLLDKVQRRMDSSQMLPGARKAYGVALGAQLGSVLGFLSQRVLGQYDVLMAHQNEVWFIGPNIVLTEKRFGFLPRDFRLWVVLHELTHRGQFEANPWVRPHFLSLIDHLLGSMEIEARTLLERLISSMKRAAVTGEDAVPFAFRLLEPGQAEAFKRLQAFMSVIEGHGNFVMDRIGQGRIPSQPRMSTVLRGAASLGSPLAKLIGKALGLELKKAQYRQGQHFFESVYARGGPSAIRACFDSAEALPSLEEVKAPELWLARVAP